MSENNKVWAEGISIKSKQLSFGTILTVGVNAEKFIAFLTKNKNEKGYVNLDIVERKELGKFGETHNCSLNNWKPTGQNSRSAPKTQSKLVVKKSAPEPVATAAVGRRLCLFVYDVREHFKLETTIDSLLYR